MTEKEAKKGRLSFLRVPRIIKDYVAIWKNEGFKSLLKKKGWKVVILIVAYYLIRDSILYILIPYLIAKGFISLN